MRKLLALTILVVFILAASPCFGGIPHLINYQGMLTNTEGVPMSGDFDLTFRIFDDSTAGTQKWGETQYGIVVSDGLFSVNLGDSVVIDLPFDEDYWLETEVGAYGPLLPRTRIVSVGYAYRAERVDTAAYSFQAQKADTADYAISADTSAYALAGGEGDNDWAFRITDTADTMLVTGGPWGISRSGNILYGNADSTHVSLGVACTTGTGGQNRKYCTVGGGLQNTASGNQSTVGGGSYNTARDLQSTVSGGYANLSSGESATIGGGWHNLASGDVATVAGGQQDTASGDFATVGGGVGNVASGNRAAVVGGTGNIANGAWAFVGAGIHNTASGTEATVGGGDNNTASGSEATVGGGKGNIASNQYATVGGGEENTASGLSATIAGGNSNTANISNSTVGGGYGNIASDSGATISGGKYNHANQRYATVGGGYTDTASGDYATVAGGVRNTASASDATVGGGDNNTASYVGATVGGGEDNAASNEDATVGGGIYNTASGRWSTVPGGSANASGGDNSFAAGRRAKANHNGTFVWADNTEADFASSGEKQFLIRASGGVGIGTSSPTEQLDVNGTARLRGITVGGVGTVNVVVDGTGKLWMAGGGNLYKENIRRLGADPEKVFQLEPVRFKWKTSGVEDIGLISEDVEKVIPDLVVYDSEGRPHGVRYDRVAVYLLEIVKKQQNEIEALREEVNALKQKNR